MSEEAWKGGFDRTSWMGRYAEVFIRAGAQPYEAECAALNAWEADNGDDVDPEDAAWDELAYRAEDAR